MASLAVTVKNDSSHPIFISGDPNWDDQVLTFDGEPAEGTERLNAGSEVVVGITFDYNQMGVIFSGEEKYDYSGTWLYQLSIGPDPETGNLTVTDSDTTRSPTVVYTLEDQAPLSMTMVFVDARSS